MTADGTEGTAHVLIPHNFRSLRINHWTAPQLLVRSIKPITGGLQGLGSGHIWSCDQQGDGLLLSLFDSLQALRTDPYLYADG
jgi:hypothetical protein